MLRCRNRPVFFCDSNTYDDVDDDVVYHAFGLGLHEKGSAVCGGAEKEKKAGERATKAEGSGVYTYL